MLYVFQDIIRDSCTGSRITTRRARAIFKAARKCRAKRVSISSSSALSFLNTESWGVKRITKNGTVYIGCRKFTYSQMIPAAKKLGFKRFD